MRIKFLSVLALCLLCVAVSVMAKPPAPPAPTGPYIITFQLVNNMSHPVTFMGGMQIFLETASDFYKKDLADEHFSFQVEVPAGGRTTHTISRKGEWNRYIVQHQLSVSAWGLGRELGSSSHRGPKGTHFVVTANPSAPIVTIGR